MTYRWTNGEPDLREMLDDDVVLAVMDRDGVSREELHDLIRNVQRQLEPRGEARRAVARDGRAFIS